MADLNIRLLGRFEAERDGQPIPSAEWRGQKTRDLFKILLLANGHYVPKDQLYDWLWPEAEPDAAQANLRSVVSDLRKILEPGLTRGRDSAYIHTQHEGYAFNTQASFNLDSKNFEQAVNKPNTSSDELQAALALYRGDLLEEDAYAEWAQRERERLRDLHLKTLTKLAALCCEDRRYAESIALSEQALAIDIAHESAWRTLMQAHLANGDRAAALNAYERCRTALGRELGVEPTVETIAVYERALREEPTSASSSNESVAKGQKAIPSSSHWWRRLAAISFMLWAVSTGLNAALALAGVIQGSYVSPGDPGEVALPYLQAHPEAMIAINQQFYLLFPVGWMLIIGYAGWWTMLRANGRAQALAGLGLAAGIVDGLTQTISRALGLTQLIVLPQAYLTATADQRLSLVVLWDVLRSLASIFAIFSLLANPLALLALIWASRELPRFPKWFVWLGIGVNVASLLYYFVPAGPVGFVLGIGLIFGVRAWLMVVAILIWQ